MEQETWYQPNWADSRYINSNTGEIKHFPDIARLGYHRFKMPANTGIEYALSAVSFYRQEICSSGMTEAMTYSIRPPRHWTASKNHFYFGGDEPYRIDPNRIITKWETGTTRIFGYNEPPVSGVSEIVIYKTREVNKMEWTVGSILMVALIAFIMIKITPKLTLKRAMKGFASLVYWPFRRFSKKAREDWDYVKEDTK